MASALLASSRTAPLAPGLLPIRTPLRSRPAIRVPELSVVIVNYCQWENTAALVQHLLATPSVQRGAAEVVIVDNHSPAHPLIRRLRRQPGVSLRRWRRNQGFARASNEGCRLSRGRWLLLLNPDVSLPDDCLENVLTLADRLTVEDPRAGVVGFQLHNSDGTRQPSSGPFPTLARTLAGLALPRARRKYQLLPARRRCRVPWVTGCCLLVRHDCLQQLGGFDEDFFLYYEDVDLCRRARAQGWSVWYEPDLHAVHHWPLHRRAVPAALRLVTRHSLLTYAAKHWPRWQFRVLAAVVRADTRLRQAWARWRGDAEVAGQFAELGRVVLNLVEGRQAKARRRLVQTMEKTFSSASTSPKRKRGKQPETLAGASG